MSLPVLPVFLGGLALILVAELVWLKRSVLKPFEPRTDRRYAWAASRLALFGKIIAVSSGVMAAVFTSEAFVRKGWMAWFALVRAASMASVSLAYGYEWRLRSRHG